MGMRANTKAPASERLDFSGLKILIIDDQEDARAMVKQMLLDIGVTQIFEAADGREGMQFLDIADDFVDIILCDWNMPGLNGLSLLQQLRSVDPDMPFLMVTGRGDMNSVAKAKGAGVSAYLLKPFSMLDLEAKLRIVSMRAGLA